MDILSIEERDRRRIVLQKQLGDNIRRIRLSKGLTLEEAVSYVEGMDDNYLGKIERGIQNTSLDGLLQISYMLCEPIDKLFCNISFTSDETEIDSKKLQTV